MTGRYLPDFSRLSQDFFPPSWNSGGTSSLLAASMARRTSGGRLPHEPDWVATALNFEGSSVRLGLYGFCAGDPGCFTALDCWDCWRSLQERQEPPPQVLAFLMISPRFSAASFSFFSAFSTSLPTFSRMRFWSAPGSSFSSR